LTLGYFDDLKKEQDAGGDFARAYAWRTKSAITSRIWKAHWTGYKRRSS
jgi:hypothetical protein